MKRVVAALFMRLDESHLWRDFNLSIGASDAWVTAYVLHALGEYAAHISKRDSSRLLDRLQPSLDALRNCRKIGGGFAYNRDCQLDADSTAWAMRAFSIWNQDSPPGTLRALLAHLDRRSGKVRTYRRTDSDDRWGWAHPDVAVSLALAALETDRLDTLTLETISQEVTSKWVKRNGTMDGFWWSSAAFPTSLLYQFLAEMGKPLPPPESTGDESDNVFDAACAILTLSSADVLDTGRIIKLTETMLKGFQWRDDKLISPAHATLQAPASLIKHSGPDETCRDLHGIFTLATALKAMCALANNHLPLPEIGHIDAPRTSYASLKGVMARGQAPEENDINPEICSLSGGYPLEYSFRLSDPSRESARFTTRLGQDEWAEPWRFHSSLDHLERVLSSSRARAIIPELRGLGSKVSGLEDPRFTLWFGVEKRLSQSAPIEKIYLNAALFGSIDSRLKVLAEWLPRLFPDFQADAILDWPELIGVSGHLQEVGIGFMGNIARVKFYWEFAEGHVKHFIDCSRRFGLTTPTKPTETAPFSDYVHPAIIPVLRSGVASRFDELGQMNSELTLALSLPKRLQSCAELSQNELWFGNRKLAGATLKPTLVTRTVSKTGLSDTLYSRPRPMR